MPAREPLRSEHDALGSVLVPAAALYGAHTVRALANFTVSGVCLRERPAFIAGKSNSLGLREAQRRPTEQS